MELKECFEDFDSPWSCYIVKFLFVREKMFTRYFIVRMCARLVRQDFFSDREMLTKGEFDSQAGVVYSVDFDNLRGVIF